MTLAEKFAAAIDQQQREVDRLQLVATVELPAARAKLAQLQALAGKVTANIEAAIVALKGSGISLDD